MKVRQTDCFDHFGNRDDNLINADVTGERKPFDLSETERFDKSKSDEEKDDEEEATTGFRRCLVP